MQEVCFPCIEGNTNLSISAGSFRVIEESQLVGANLHDQIGGGKTCKSKDQKKKTVQTFDLIWTGKADSYGEDSVPDRTLKEAGSLPSPTL